MGRDKLETFVKVVKPVSKSWQTSSSNQNFSILDFERSIILHVPGIKPKQVALCAEYVAVQAELEVLVLKLESSFEPKEAEECLDTQKYDDIEDQSDFLFLPRNQELLGDQVKNCDISVSIEKTGLEDRGQYTLSYVLFRRFSPDFSQGCSVEDTQLHSLQLHPLFISNQSLEEPACVFCFFSLPNAGFLYSLKGGVELLSAYQYLEKVLEAVLTNHLLHVITKSAVQCFTAGCAAVAARIEDPYIDTTMKNRLTNSETHPKPSHTPPARRSLKSAEDFINSCSHYGALYPWLTVLCPVHMSSAQHQEALHKLQSLLCGPSLSVGSVVPLLERLSDETLWGFSLHLLCATRREQYGSSIEKLLDRCPQAIIAYANHQLQDKNMVCTDERTALWWQKLLPELCNRTRWTTASCWLHSKKLW
ncbi:Hermansky-Pudlak syndrome 3 protein-like [Sphaeramia orbicularis]|uniref:Hermansky-Pudlak syndrome 3 protein-like n=1 Tax=Sphaeramia orbicularis TaxID=375764 RepID=UPI00118140C6|nr:Hermansky-Pudlak syndrome 3 protein-like [Sphaeramia orbicularis]